MTARVTDSPPATASPLLEARGVRIVYGDHVAVNDVTLTVRPGRITAVVGPNGCGKSTLLRALGRLQKVAGGEVRLDGQPIGTVATRQVARQISVLPQSPVAPEGITVADLVIRGRQPHQRWFRQWSRDDEKVVAEALRWTDMLDLAARPLELLSGGQRQRAWLSMALAQETDILLLDEPTTFLDLTHQLDVLDLVARLNAQRGRTVLMVLHDLNLAARYADTLVAMKDGRLVAEGPPADVLTEELLAEVFDLRAQVVPDPVTGTPLVIPLPRR